MKFAKRFSLVVSGLLACVSMLHAQPPQDSRSIPFFIGTYTGGASQGIYVSRLDLADGSLAEPRLVATLTNPSFLAVHPHLPVLYAISEVPQSDHQVVAYKIGEDLSLTEIGNSHSAGDGPCYVSTDSQGKFLFVANYGSGSVAVFRLAADGNLAELTSTHQHRGSSVNAKRQQEPHAHCILPDPTDRYVCAVDLGMDQVVIYQLERETGKLNPTSNPLQVTPGHGPRHLAFHPDGQHAFVIHELTCRLSVCSWDADNGVLNERGELSTIPGDMQPGFSTAEVLVHPSGRYVFGSNRGHDSITAFRFNRGELVAIGNTSTGGKTPRNFRLDPTGNYLLAENQQSDSIVVFKIDTTSGALSPTGKQIKVGMPCCIKFVNQP